jgi:glycosyltransferase involved in cell wall biosynthesis
LQLKKILLFTDWYEPGYKAGGPIQSTRNFVGAMHDLYSISVITSDTDLGESKPYEGIPANRWIDRAPGVRVYYASPKTLKAALIKDLIDTEKPDFIYLNSMYSIRFSLLPLYQLWRNKIRAKVILSPRGMLRESAIRPKSTRKKLFITLLNRLQIPSKIIFHATDEQEKKDIGHYFPRAPRVELIPNFSAELPSEVSPIEKNPGRLRCIYISRIMGIKNISFFLDLLKDTPDTILIDLSIYGEVEDENYWREAKQKINLLPKHIRVEYYGPLPHADVIPALGAHHIFVLPTLGENFGHAIFESFSAGRPVLISNKTPWQNLRNQLTGWDLPLENPRAWINALIDAAEWDQSAFDSWSRASRAFAERHVTQFNLKQDYLKLFN